MSSRFDSRTARARAMADSGRIIRTEAGFLVPSSKPGIWYEVTLSGDDITCGCEDAKHNRCYHAIACGMIAKKERELENAKC